MLNDETDRKIVPRWRDFRSTVLVGELESSASSRAIQPIAATDESLQELRREWQEQHQEWVAADLVSVATSLGTLGDYLDVLEELPSASDPTISRVATLLSNAQAAKQPSNIEPRIRARFLKLRTRDEPLNAIAWTDLARQYAVLGQPSKAFHAMRVACQLAPFNRFIVRSAARLYLHLHEPALALRALRIAAASRDPWIIAADIAVSSALRLPAFSGKVGQALMNDDRLSLASRSDLLSAVATLELENGNSRQAKKLYRASVSSPNENSLAQLEWASRVLPELEVNPSIYNLPKQFEANAQNAFQQRQWELAADNAKAWLNDQPFSSKAAIFVSYLNSTVLEEYDQSIKALEKALVISPESFRIKNNLAFALASIGRTEDARQALRGIHPNEVSDASAVALIATHGLVAYREGHRIIGRALYNEAIEGAQRLNNPKYRALAALFQAREEIVARSDWADEAYRRAEDYASRVKDPEMERVVENVRKLRRDTEKDASSTTIASVRK